MRKVTLVWHSAMTRESNTAATFADRVKSASESFIA